MTTPLAKEAECCLRERTRDIPQTVSTNLVSFTYSFSASQLSNEGGYPYFFRYQYLWAPKKHIPTQFQEKLPVFEIDMWVDQF